MGQETESRWLLAYLHKTADPDLVQSLDRLPSPDWDALIQRAMEYGVAPLLFHRLQTTWSTVQLPSHALDILHTQYRDSMIRGMQLYKTLHDLLEPFHTSGIPVIVLKGAHLAQLVYNNVALRPMVDLDILVRKSDVAQAHALMLANGYIFSGDQTHLETEHFHYVYLPREGSVAVEIHWHIQYPNIPVDIDGLWARALPANIAGAEVLVLSPEDLLLHLCMHVSSHHLYGWFGLRALCDISETLCYYNNHLNWQTLYERARAWGVHNAVYLTLLLTREMVGPPIGDNLLNGFCPDDFDPRFVTWAENRIFSGADIQFDDAVMISDGFGRLWASKRFFDKLVILLNLSFPAQAILRRKYGLSARSWRVFLYYPLHVGDFLLRHGRTVWLMLRRDAGTMEWADREAGRVSLVKWLAPIHKN